MLMTTELVINWSPGDRVQSLPVLRKLERLSDGDGTSDQGSRSYLVFCICIASLDSDFCKEHAI